MSMEWSRRDVLAAAGAGVAAGVVPGAAWSQTGEGAATGNPILIGQSIPLSGPVGAAFQQALQGQQLAIDSINRKGGINGRKLQLIQLDDGFDPRRTVENVVTMIDKEKVLALTGLGSAPGVAASLPILLEKKVPLFGVYTGAHLLRTKHHPYFFTTAASYKDEVYASVKHMVTLRQDRIAVIYHNNEFGKLMLPVAEEAVKELGGTLVASLPLGDDGRDVVGIAQQLAAKGALAVLVIAIAGPGVIGYVKAHKAFLSVPMYMLGTSAGALPYLGEDARGIAVTQVAPYPWRHTNPTAREYAKDTARAKQTIGYAHYAAYLMFTMLAEGIRLTGRNLTPQTLTRTFNNMKLLNVDGGPDVRFTPNNHHPVRFVEITVVGPRGTFIR